MACVLPRDYNGCRRRPAGRGASRRRLVGMEKIDVYAVVVSVVRVDDLQLEPGRSIDDATTIKGILPTLEKAQAEVARLNELNADKDCHYFVQYTRYFHRAVVPPAIRQQQSLAPFPARGGGQNEPTECGTC